MQDRRAVRRKPARREVEEEAGDGIVIRLAEQVYENPAMSGGLVVMALTAMAIVSNALFMQNARHPDPLFMTRPEPVLATPKPVPTPRPRVEPSAEMPAPAPVVQPAAAPMSTGDAVTIAKVQRALVTRGLYNGAVDGIAGSRTRAAISAYEKAEGLPVTGAASAKLLDHLRTGSVKPVAVPTSAPSPKPAFVPPEPIPQTAPTKPAAEAQPLSAPIAQAASPVAPPAEDPIAAVAAPESAGAFVSPAPTQTAVAAAEPPVPPKPDPAALEQQRMTDVQNALNQIGYGPVPADGQPNDATENAIRRFELDNGLPITGKLGDRVVKRLVAIGAMKAT